MAGLLLAVWFPDWPLSALGSFPADLAAVEEGGVLISVSKAARYEGAKRGMRAHLAVRLLPEMKLLSRDRQLEERLFQRIKEALLSCSFAIEVPSPGICLLPFEAVSSYLGGPKAALACIRELAEDAMPISDAPPIQMGIAASRFGALEAAKRNLFVKEEDTSAFLESLPVSSLGIPDLSYVMELLGVKDIGALSRLPREGVALRYGKKALRAMSFALEKNTSLRTDEEGEIVSRISLDHPLDEAKALGAHLARLAAKLCQAASRCHQAVGSVEVLFRWEDGTLTRRRWGSREGLDAEEILQRCSWLIESLPRLAPPKAQGVIEIELRATRKLAEIQAQERLVGQDHRDEEKLMEVLFGLVGPGAVFWLEPLPARWPKEMGRLCPRPAFGEEGPTHVPSGPLPGGHPFPLPAVVYWEEPAVQVLNAAGGGVFLDPRGFLRSEPARLVYKKTHLSILYWSGPWLDRTEWWRPASGLRARIQVVCSNGTAHLCRFEGGRWFLEATYD
jgi:protein ImuB